MKKILTSALFIYLIISGVCYGQYRLQLAFPNMLSYNNPVELVNAGDGSNRLFVVQQNGIIYTFNNTPTVSLRKIFLNLQPKVTQGGAETGLLGLAFHPNYENNRYLYVSYTFDSIGNPSRTWSRVSRYTASESNPDTVLWSTEHIILTISQPDLNHKGGKILFGPDGYLYLSFGDGGGDGDPTNQAQNKFSFLGKILRINVDSAAPGMNYSIPASNPFYGTGFRQEIFAYGFRNVWKFSYDFPSNRIWAGDVGQDMFEEIDLVESGKNYGWKKVEGFHCYPDSNVCDTTGMGFTKPIVEYRHNVQGNSVTGGYVYRGSLHPGLYGKYIYGDYIYGTIWALDYDGINPAVVTQVLDSNILIASFGVDENNELYMCRYSAAAGRIYKIVNFGMSTLSLKYSIEGFYNEETNRLSMTDTVRVYLRQNTAPYAVVDSALTRIDSLNFTGLCFFNNAPNGKYYIQVRHRNALETWSRAGGDSIKTATVNEYDFTTGAAKTFGNNSMLKGSKYCSYSGDVIEYGAINLTDMVKVYNDAVVFSSGYPVSDLTGSGIVDLADIVIVYNNSVNFVHVVTP